MSKIFAISSTGKTEKSFLDLRFGKCENIVTYNPDNKEVNFFENPFKDNDYSGVKLVNFLNEKGVSVIITGEVGPKVNKLLEEKKLQLVLLDEEKIKIEDIILRISSSRQS
jgi:predicted Fe-Mo cluster-binding NifX family protein